jgi:hypothetical protein
LFTLVIASFFTVLGYSIAKPFGEIGEPTKKTDKTSSNDAITEISDSDSSSAFSGIQAYWIKDTELESVDALSSRLDIIGKEYNMVVVPLKIEGGKLNYQSSNESAVLAEATNEIPLSSIIDTINSKGFTPAASVNTLQDNIYPKTNKNAGFLIESTKALWTDSNNKETGKPWMNPASSDTKEYLSSITGEIAQCGFKYIITTNTEYPAFSENALTKIGATVTDKDRYLNLVDIVNAMSKTAESKESNMWIEIPAYEMFTGNCEVFQPILLKSQKYVLKIDVSKFNSEITCNGKKIDFSKMTVSEKIKTICSETENTIYKTSFIPEITSVTLTGQQKEEILKVFEELKYDSYIIR